MDKINLILIKMLTNSEYRVFSYIRANNYHWTSLSIVEFCDLTFKTVYKCLGRLRDLNLITKCNKGEGMNKIENFNGTVEEFFENNNLNKNNN